MGIGIARSRCLIALVAVLIPAIFTAGVVEDARAAVASEAVDGTGAPTLTIAYAATGAAAEHVTIAKDGSAIVLSGDVTGVLSTSTATRLKIEVPNEADSTNQSLTFLDGTYSLPDGIYANNPNLDHVTLGTAATEGGSVAITSTDNAVYLIATAVRLASDTTLTTWSWASLNASPLDGAHALTVSSRTGFIAGNIGATTPLTSLTVSAYQTYKPATRPMGVFRTTGSQSYVDVNVLPGSGLTSTTGAVDITGRITGASGSLAISNATASTITESLVRTPEGPLGADIDLTKNGVGTLTLATDSLGFNGTVTVNSGRLNVQTQYGIGRTTPGSVVVAAGATFAVAPASLATGSIALSGTLAATGSGDQTLAGTIDVTGNAIIDVAAGSSLSVYELTDPATPTGQLSKRGDGELRIDSATNFASDIGIDAGRIMQSTGDALGTGTVTVADGACLRLAGLFDLTGNDRLEVNGTCGGAGAIHTFGFGASPTIGVPIHLATSSTIAAGLSNTLTIGGGITANAGAGLSLAGSGGITVVSDIAAASLTSTIPLRVENPVGAQPPETVIATTGTQTHNADITLAGDVRLQASGLLGTGNITSTGQAQRSLTLDISGAVSAYSGTIGGAGGSSIGLLKRGVGTIAIGTATYTGPTRTFAGTLRLTGASATQTITAEETGHVIVDADLSGISAIVDSGARLSGSGSLRDVRVDGALALDTSGSLAFQLRKLNGLGGTLRAAIGDPAAHTTITVTGSAGNASNLNDLTLDLRMTTPPTGVDPVTLIDNRGEIVGTFRGAPQGGLIATGSTLWRIDYAGGDGDDVTLAYVPPPTIASVAPATGFTTGGTTITITGSGFAAGAQVTVGGAPCGSVAVVSTSTVTCTTPSGTEGPATVVVTNADTQTATRPGAFTFEAPPVPNAGAQSVPASTARTTRIQAPRATGRVVRVTIAAGGAGTATLRAADRCRASRKVTKAGTVELSCRIRRSVTRVRVTAAFTPVIGAVVTRTAVVRLAR